LIRGFIKRRNSLVIANSPYQPSIFFPNDRSRYQ
jgi:hypothetical protein